MPFFLVHANKNAMLGVVTFHSNVNHLLKRKKEIVSSCVCASTITKCGCSSLVPVHQTSEFIASPLGFVHYNQWIHS